MDKRFIAAIDEGTTSARAVVFDVAKNSIISIVNTPFDLVYPQPGWVEVDANEIWAVQLSALTNVIAKSRVKLKDLAGIGIANQRETVVVWDKETGEPVYNAIVWQCRRTAEFCERLKNDEVTSQTIFRKTGLIIDAYFSASKIKWVLDNVEGVRERAEKGELLAGTVDSWLVYKLTDGKVHVTDISNASRTMLYNIKEKCWDDELLELFDIPKCLLAEVVDSDQIVGKTSVLKEEVDICGILGDQQSALFGHGCFEKGCAKNTYGTGCFILMNMGTVPKFLDNQLITTVAWTQGGKTVYALEGSIFNAGSAVQWLRDQVNFFHTSSESEDLARCAKNSDGTDGTDGVYFVPAFTGLGAPYWNMDARGLIVGITRNTNKFHITRAVLEAMAYSTKDILIKMESDSGVKLRELACDGGASRNDFLMQFQADVLQNVLRRPRNVETTVLGAVYMCGLGLRVWKSLSEVSSLKDSVGMFKPQMSKEVSSNLYLGWKQAIKKAID